MPLITPPTYNVYNPHHNQQNCLFLCCFYVAHIPVNVLVAHTDRNVHFIAWATVSELHALFVLFRTLLVATILKCHVGEMQ